MTTVSLGERPSGQLRGVRAAHGSLGAATAGRLGSEGIARRGSPPLPPLPLLLFRAAESEPRSSPGGDADRSVSPPLPAPGRGVQRENFPRPRNETESGGPEGEARGGAAAGARPLGARRSRVRRAGRPRGCRCPGPGRAGRGVIAGPGTPRSRSVRGRLAGCWRAAFVRLRARFPFRAVRGGVRPGGGGGGAGGSGPPRGPGSGRGGGEGGVSCRFQVLRAPRLGSGGRGDACVYRRVISEPPKT